MHNHRGFSGKALLIVLIILMVSVPLMAGAALSLGLLPFRMHTWDGDTVRHWGLPMRFLSRAPFLFCFGPLLHLGALALIVGLFMRLSRHRRWHACHPGHGSGDKSEHPHFRPRGHWHIYWQPDEAEDTDKAEPAGRETQEFKVE